MQKEKIKEKEFEDIDWKTRLYNKLIDSFKKVKVFQEEGKISFKVGSNNYDFFIYSNRRINNLRMSAIISGLEYDYAISIQNSLNTNFLQYEIMKGRGGYYDSIWATLNIELNANNIHYLHEVESDSVVNAIMDFICKTEEIKDYCYANRKQLYNGGGF